MNLLKSPVFYLVGSNLVFWGVPLLLIQFRSETVVEAPSAAPAPATVAVSGVAELDRDPLAVGVVPADDLDQQQPKPEPPPASLPVVAAIPPTPVEEPQASEPPLNLMKELKGAAGLGGPITLKSLKEPLMPVAARVERQQQKRSGDRLAALPRHWRDSLRQELPAAKPVSEAMVVRLPVPALKQRQEVPVIVNERGEGEALVAPQDPRVRQAVEGWAARQAAASPGTVQVYVVAAEPLGTSTP